MLVEKGFEFSVTSIPKLVRRLVLMKINKDFELDRITSAFGNPIELARQYVVPDCQQVNPADYNEEEPPTVVRTDVFEVLRRLFAGDMSIRDGRSQMFILSDAGMGKTSLLKMIKYFHMTRFWPNNYRCELIKLGPKSIDHIANVKPKNKTVLLLDGLDEDLTLGDVEAGVEEILGATVFFHRTIITCRTQFFPKHLSDPMKRSGFVKIASYRCPVVYLSPFDDQKVVRFIKKKFPKKLFDYLLFSENYLVTRSMQLLENMHSLRLRPMLLAHIEDLIRSSLTSWSEFSVYSVLIEAWLDRELREKPWREGARRPSEEELLDACKQLALLMFEEKLAAVPPERIYQLIEDRPSLRLLRLMDLTGRSLLNRTSDNEFRFSHYSIGEFLATRALIEAPEDRSSIPFALTQQMTAFVESFCRDKILRDTYPSSYKVNLSGLDLGGSDFSGCDLQGFNFDNADLSRVDFENARLQYASLRNSTLTRARLLGARLQRADLSEANLKGARYDSATAWPEAQFDARKRGAFDVRRDSVVIEERT